MNLVEGEVLMAMQDAGCAEDPTAEARCTSPKLYHTRVEIKLFPTIRIDTAIVGMSSRFRR